MTYSHSQLQIWAYSEMIRRSGIEGWNDTRRNSYSKEINGGHAAVKVTYWPNWKQREGGIPVAITYGVASKSLTNFHPTGRQDFATVPSRLGLVDSATVTQWAARNYPGYKAWHAEERGD